MARYRGPIRVFPGRIIGVETPYNAAFIERFKGIAPMRMWDQSAKMWWFPANYQHIVFEVALECGALRKRDVDGYLSSVSQPDGPAEDYKTLGVMPGAARGLVKAAFYYWKSEFESVGGAGEMLAALERAYERIMSITPGDLPP